MTAHSCRVDTPVSSPASPLPTSVASYRANLDHCKFRASIDWIDVELTLQRPSQFRHVQSRMESTFGKLFIKPIEGEASSRKFRIRIQNPDGPEQLMRDIQCAVADGEPSVCESEIRILAVEIALDVYWAGASVSELAGITALLLNRLSSIPDSVVRLTGPRRYRAAASPADLQAALKEQVTAHIGESTADWRVRAYVKSYDTDTEQSYRDLPTEQHRARIEVTLSDTKVPFSTVDGWKRMDAKSLTGYFAMCLPAAESERQELLLERKLLLGRAPNAPKMRNSDRRKRPPITRRDSALNERIRNAIRMMIHRQVCRNSVKESAAELPATEGCTLARGDAPKYINTQDHTHHRDDQLHGSKSALSELVPSGPVQLVTAGAVPEHQAGVVADV